MNKADISVIMPVYNGEKYLGETLENLLKQTYKNFEVICINDASTDATLDILKKFRKQDGRIRILENDMHAGAAHSRNRGLQVAEGKYITFLDGDDIFEEEMLASAYRAMERYDTDIVIYEQQLFSSEHIYEKKKIWRSDGFREKYCTVPFSVRNCEPEELMNWGSGPCNKLYRKRFIEENRLEFQSLPSANDVCFVNMALLLAGKMIMLDDRRIMVYAREHDEVTRISYDRDPMCAYQAMRKLGQELVDRGLFHEVFRHYYYLLFNILRYAIMNTKSVEMAGQFYDFLQREGINEIASLSRECYEIQDTYIRNLLENYKNLDFNSEWYKSETIFAYRLYKNAPKVLSVFSLYENNKKKVALWGVGVNGRIFLKILRKHGLKVLEVVDKDKRKQGTVLEGYKIRQPEEIIGKVQVVAVCTSLIYREVVMRLEGTGIEVINIEQILQEE